MSMPGTLRRAPTILAPRPCPVDQRRRSPRPMAPGCVVGRQYESRLRLAGNPLDHEAIGRDPRTRPRVAAWSGRSSSSTPTTRCGRTTSCSSGSCDDYLELARPPHARPRRPARGARRRRAGHHRGPRLRQRELPAQPARLLRAAGASARPATPSGPRSPRLASALLHHDVELMPGVAEALASSPPATTCCCSPRASQPSSNARSTPPGSRTTSAAPTSWPRRCRTPTASWSRSRTCPPT